MSNKKKTLSKILKIKDSRKKEAEIEMKKAFERADEEKSKLDALEQDQSEALEVFHENTTDGSMDANKLSSWYDYFSSINGKIEKQKSVYRQSKQELRKVKDNLLDAHREKKAFEMLSEKETDHERREEQSTEQRESDFLAVSRRLK